VLQINPDWWWSLLAHRFQDAVREPAAEGRDHDVDMSGWERPVDDPNTVKRWWMKTRCKLWNQLPKHLRAVNRKHDLGVQ
jgi:hypothetical protein